MDPQPQSLFSMLVEEPGLRKMGVAACFSLLFYYALSGEKSVTMHCKSYHSCSCQWHMNAEPPLAPTSIYFNVHYWYVAQGPAVNADGSSSSPKTTSRLG